MLLKTDIQDTIKTNLGVSTRDAGIIFDCMENLFRDAILKNEGIKVFGVGTLHVKILPERVRRNPRTGEQVNLPESRKVIFKPSHEIQGLLKSNN